MQTTSRPDASAGPAAAAPERPARVGISGSYGGMNLGDEAILQTIVEGLRRDAAAVEVTVFSRDAGDTLRRHAVEHAVDARRISRAEARATIADLDLFVLGGGGILYDSDAERYLRDVLLALEVGTPVLVYAISVGPLTSRHVRELVRDAMQRVEWVTVRDRESQQLLEDIGVARPVELTADPALLLEPEPLSLTEICRREAIDPERTLVAFSVREPGPAAPDLDVVSYHRLLANAADFAADRLDADVVFVPLERRVSDVQHSHGVVAGMRLAHRATVLRGEYRPGQIVSLLQHFQLAIGMRLHFLVFSALAGLPLVALPYASKVRGFIEDLGIAGSSVQDVSAGQLIAHLDRVWDERAEQCARTRAALAGLRDRARRSDEHAKRILRARRSALSSRAG